MRRAILMVFATVVVLLGVPIAAHAQSDPIAGAVAGLKGHTVYVASDSGQDVTPAEVQSLEAQIGKGRAAIFIAVLPESAASAAGGVDALPHTLAIAMGDPTAVVGVVSGHSFRAGSKAGAGLDAGEAGNFAKAAISAHSPASNRLTVMLSDWVTRVDNRVAARPTGRTATATKAAGMCTDWGKILLILLAVCLIVPAIIVGIWLVVKKRRQEAELARRRSVLKRRLEDLSGDVLNQEAGTALNDNAKAAYSNAVTAYQSANSRFSDTASELELDDVEHYVEISEAAMSDAKEYAAGRDPHPVQPVSVSRVASLRPKQTYAKADAPKAAPTQTTTVVNNYNGGNGGSGRGGYWQGNYNGYGYGYYPGYGWGYYGNDGGFVAGMLAAEMMEDRHEERYEHEDRDSDDRDSGSEPSYSSSSSDSGGSGDWGSSSSPSYDSSPSTDFGGGGDWGGGGGGDSGGGGGGDW